LPSIHAIEEEEGGSREPSREPEEVDRKEGVGGGPACPGGAG